MEKTRIGVVFGGRSGEHEISIRSAATVIRELDRDKYEIVPLAISNDGEWLNAEASLGMLPESARQSVDLPPMPDAGHIVLPGDTSFGGILATGRSASDNAKFPLDVVFPVLHGTFGEDGTIQGLLEMSGLPYVGCGVLASSCGMDKVVMKTLFRDADLPQCDYVWFLRKEWEESREAVMDQIEAKLGFPCFVKPANLGSSVGVSKVAGREQLKEAVDLAAAYDRKIIVEECIEMREVECAVIGNDDPEASLPGEYVVYDDDKKFLDFTEKYEGTGNNEFVVPAKINAEQTDTIRRMAADAFKAVDGSGFARVDFFLRNDNNEILINEINTIPGLTDASGFPKMWEGSGVAFSAVLDRLVQLAFERHSDKARNRTDR